MKNEKLLMNKKGKTKFNFLLVSVCMILFLYGCSDSARETARLLDGKHGFFVLTVGKVNAQRTILPDITQSGFSKYLLVFSADGEEINEERINSNLESEIILPVGLYDLTVTAYVEYEGIFYPAASGTLKGINIAPDEITSRNIELFPIITEGAAGIFSWNIGFPDDLVSASMTIEQLVETDPLAVTVYFKGGDSDNTVDAYAFDVIPAGYYKVTFRLSNGLRSIGRVEYLHIYQNLESYFEYNFTQDHFIILSVINGADNGLGSLRYAIGNAPANSAIVIEESVETIYLESPLVINKNLTIEGNGVTITRRLTWTETNVSSQLLRVGAVTPIGVLPSEPVSAGRTSEISALSEEITDVNIRRIHFKDGRAAGNGGAINIYRGTLNLESCIFSGNQISESDARGGAICNNGTLNIRACTFYANSSPYRGGAVYNSSGTVTLTGNIFYGNNFSANQVHGVIINSRVPVVYNESGTVTSGGYNVVDVPFGTEPAQSGFTAGTNDSVFSNILFSVKSFKLFRGSAAAEFINPLPVPYPSEDFYGNPITANASAGAVQEILPGNFMDLIVNNSTSGSVSVSAEPGEDGLYQDSYLTFMAAPADGYGFFYWLVNGHKAGSENPMELEISYTTVHAVFGLIVNSSSDAAGSETVPGTLRYALTNALDGDIIRLGESMTILLTRRLPEITKSITIEGSGSTLTRASSWTAENDESQLMYITSGTVNIRRLHFKDGRTANYGAAIYKTAGTLTLESCIFSGNQTSQSNAAGGAIYNNAGTLNVKGCTFYNNRSAGQCGAIYNGGTLTLIGNLFYLNTAAVTNQVMFGGTSGGYNVVDIAIGTGGAQSGWTAVTGDRVVYNRTFSTRSFKVFKGSGVTGVIPLTLDDYPSEDFYGKPIPLTAAAAGAVQEVLPGNYMVLTINNSNYGSVSVSSEPNEDGLYENNITLTAEPKSGYALLHWLVGGISTGGGNTKTLNLNGYTDVQAVFGHVVNLSGDTNTAGTLRYALTNALDGDIIRLGESMTIMLTSRLPAVTRNITIEGSGSTLTRASAWTVDANSQLLYMTSGTVNISRLHFKDGRATNYGGAIYKTGGTLTLESCIFSGNLTSGTNYAYGGAVYNAGTLNVRGCTFYNNKTINTGSTGGAIYNAYGGLYLAGNLFYSNTAASSYQVVTSGTSGGYNVVNADIGTGTAQSGWAAATGDKTVTSQSFSEVSFELLSGSGAANVITSLPSGYPKEDFYGKAITAGAAAGAVQSSAVGIHLTTNGSALGTVSGAVMQNGLYPNDATVEAVPVGSARHFLYWIVNGEKDGNENPRTFALDGYNRVQAVFGHIVNLSGDTAQIGTLRYALTNALDGDVILFTGGPRVIELTSALPAITRNIEIDGNGSTLTRASAYTATSTTSQLLYMTSGTVNISRLHFKDGRATNYGAAVYKTAGTLTLESCIFSGNQTSGTNALGGAIYNSGTLNVRGCTFYNNSTINTGSRGGAIYNAGGLYLAGNLFYSNTAASYQVVYPGAAQTSGGYNVVDIAIGTGTAQSGWAAGTADKYVSERTFSLLTLKPLTVGEAVNVITMLPSAYPKVDFNGSAITNGAAAGAIQSTADGYFVDTSVNIAARGNVSVSPNASADGLYSGVVTITPNAEPGFEFSHWLIAGVKNFSNPFVLTLNAHIALQAVFARTVNVTDFNDTITAGTLRNALINALDEDIIYIRTENETIMLTSRLEITRRITIAGNGVTLTRAPAWISVTDTSQMMRVTPTATDVTINSIHFKDGRAASNGVAILNEGTLLLKTCIFSGNTATSIESLGGSIYNSGRLTVTACTFYQNSAFRGGAIYNAGSSLVLQGNIFYGNTFSGADGSGPVIYRASGTVTSAGYNAVDFNFGDVSAITANNLSGFTASTGDVIIAAIPFSETNFSPIHEGGADNVITILPANYPNRDFYGKPVSNGAAAGAVQP